MKKILSIFMLLLSISMFSATTWNGTSWSNGVPNSSDDVTITGNYTVNSSTGILDCKSLEIKGNAVFTVTTGYYVNIWAQDLTNLENGKVIIKSGGDILIRNGGGQIKNAIASNFIIEDGGSIVQLLGNAINEGQITFQRNTKPVKLNDYTCWSSPVSNQQYSQLPPNPAPTPGLRVFGYDNLTSSYYGWNAVYASNPSGTMIIGKGYIAHKAIVNDPNPQQVYTMNFIGVPNNGSISVNLTSYIGPRPNLPYQDGSMYLAGNPYPSSLDMVAFLTDNNSSAIHLRTHNTIISSSIVGSELYNYTADDYATFNLTGGVAASSPIVDGTPNNTSTPTRYIGSGQGFFVKAPQLGSKTFNFSNNMRGLLPTATNTQFYRQENVTEKHRIWLFLTNNFNITRYNAIGYVTGATNGFDHQYDAVMADGRVAAIYSILDDEDLTIQGKSLPFNNQDIIPLGYKLPEGGSFQIGLNDVDGLFTDVSQPIYLEDLELGVIHNLRNSNYSFTATTGTNETRFRLRFINTTLDNTSIYSYNGQVNVKSNQSIKDIYVYDMLGRVVNQFNNINSNDKSFTLNNDGVYIVKVKLENDAIITKKIAN